jgi:hypothetical protein
MHILLEQSMGSKIKIINPYPHAGETQVQNALKQGIITEADILKHLGEEEPEKAEMPEMNKLKITSSIGQPEESEEKVQLANNILHRTTTTSTEDALAGMLFETITKGEITDLSPQTVLPAEKNQSNVPPVGASATKPSRGPKIAPRALNEDEQDPEWPQAGTRVLSPRVLEGLGAADAAPGDCGGDHINWEHLARELFS